MIRGVYADKVLNIIVVIETRDIEFPNGTFIEIAIIKSIETEEKCSSWSISIIVACIMWNICIQ